MWELAKASMRVVRPLSDRATTGERAWKRERVSAPPCMWDLGHLGARLLGTSCFTPSNELPRQTNGPDSCGSTHTLVTVHWIPCACNCGLVSSRVSPQSVGGVRRLCPFSDIYDRYAARSRRPSLADALGTPPRHHASGYVRVPRHCDSYHHHHPIRVRVHLYSMHKEPRHRRFTIFASILAAHRTPHVHRTTISSICIIIAHRRS